MKPFFSYYGGKWLLAPKYPAPEHPTIVEPFAGSAGYSVRNADRNVRLYDLNEKVIGTWQYLIGASEYEIRRLPLIGAGEIVNDLPVVQEARWLIGWWLNKATTHPSNQISAWGLEPRYRRQFWGEEIRDRIARQVDRIRHWTADQKSYEDVPDDLATWFVDPPYAGPPGRRYSHHEIDYAGLADWCKSRSGQTIVCENEGADWLPFQPFIRAQGTSGKGRTGTSHEAIWIGSNCGTVVQLEQDKDKSKQVPEQSPTVQESTSTSAETTVGDHHRSERQGQEKMTLQNFQPKARISGDKMDLRNYFGRPLLVRVTEFVPDFTSQAFPTPKPVVFADVVDLASGQIFVNVLWGGGAVVDNLKDHAGTDVVLPLQAQNATGGSGRNYIALQPLDDATAAAAGQWYQQNWGVVEQTRQQRMAAAQAAAPAPQQNQFQQPSPQAQQAFQPVQQVQQGFGQPVSDPQAQPVQQGFGQPTAQPNQFQQPAPQQGFGQPVQGQTQPGMFSDQMPPVQQGQGFAAPQGTDPAAAQAALQQLNGQLGG